MKARFWILQLIGTILFTGCIPPFHAIRKEVAYESKSLKIIPISNNAFVHVSYLLYRGIPVGCNGLIYRNKNRVVVFDTPTEDSVSHELINWIEQNLESKVVAVIPGHFHNDCLGGLEAFHERGASSYANALTRELAAKDEVVLPQNTFEGFMELLEGKVQLWYPGEGHTRDNIVGYMPKEKLLFGGCLVKSLNANKGFTGDANEQEWSLTVTKVKTHFPKVETVIPGHGRIGNQELLDYTISLFTVD